jgi:hypothetical protein
MVKVLVEGRNVTSVPRLLFASPRAFAELHEVVLAVAPNGELEPARQRVHDRDADAVQATGNLVGILVEFPAGMQLGHDDFGCRYAFTFVNVGRDAAPVVPHRAGTIGIERYLDFSGKSGKRLVDGIVHHLVDHMVEAGAVIGITDIHAGPLAHGIESFEDLDGLGAIVGWVSAGRFSHRRHPRNGSKIESE